MDELSSAIEIDAPVERVWLIATNFAAYPQWNRFLPRMRGELIPGAKLEVHLRLPGRRALRLKGRVVAVQPERRLHWLGYLLIPGFMAAQYMITLERCGEHRTRMTQSMQLTGLLTPLLGSTIDRAHQAAEDMQLALRARAEASGQARQWRMKQGEGNQATEGRRGKTIGSNRGHSGGVMN